MTRARRLCFAALAVVACHDDRPASDAASDATAPDAAITDAPPDVAQRASCGANDPVPCPPLTYATWRMPSPPGVSSSAPATYALTASTASESITGLTWQRAFTERLTWAAAKQYCDALELEGRTDWRVPSRIELVSLVDFTRLPSIDQEAFPDTANDYFWASSPVAGAPALAFSVYFGAGLTAVAQTGGSSAHVRCVRGGGPGVLPRYEQPNDSVFDRNTLLTWQRTLLDQELVWESAKEYCESLKNGWRLPSTKELQTIVDETQRQPALDTALFPNTPTGLFWTSTPVNKSGLTNYIFVDVRDGTTEEASKDDAHWVRCVR